MGSFARLSSDLGVDLVEIKKAKAFYDRHKKRLPSFFSPKEMAYIQTSKRPGEAVAVLLAAKEAVFKSIGSDMFGKMSFQEIRIFFAADGRLSFKLPKKIPKGFSRLQSTLSILKTKEYVVATCHRKDARCVGIS